YDGELSNSSTEISKKFALAMEACRRETDMEIYGVQIYAGSEMAKGRICEMKTGEGKTLTAILPLYLLGSRKSGVHLATANDYLANRDATFAKPILDRLGLSVGVVTSDSNYAERRQAYRCDVTYGTAKEFGFDFLRDQLNQVETPTILSLNNIIVDEADNLLIDEARTPLIIGAIDTQKETQRSTVCRWAEGQSVRFVEGMHYKYHKKSRRIEYLPEGVLELRSLRENEFTRQLSLRELGEYLENAIRVRRDYQRDDKYTVVDGKIVIIDEYTGRLAEGRQWQRGIHQAVEAKEGLEITSQTERAASITIQSLIKKYDFACGMTGTAWSSRNEFDRVYKLKVSRIPTNKRIRRRKYRHRIFDAEQIKFESIASEIESVVAENRAVLVGTRTVEKSELLSQILHQKSIAHEILNAKNLANEAALVAEAGCVGKVTVATNMAGRGTDIMLEDKVVLSGGLHVILTELHESARIDWQLIGRGCRQGDPGSFQIFLSLQDSVLERGLSKEKLAHLRTKYAGRGELQPSLFRHFLAAQRNVEAKQLADRLVMIHQEDERMKLFHETGENPFLSPVSVS
ncbi:MAG: DEAD/DEAH box helicase, partial [Planctomycetota bacterium]